MWDRERLDSWNRFGRPWHGLDIEVWNEMEIERVCVKRERLEESARIMIQQGKLQPIDRGNIC